MYLVVQESQNNHSSETGSLRSFFGFLASSLALVCKVQYHSITVFTLLSNLIFRLSISDFQRSGDNHVLT